MTDGREIIPATAKAPPAWKDFKSASQIVTGVGVALGSLYFPPAALAAPVISILIDKFVKGPENILNDKLGKNGIGQLTEDQSVAFFPMAYNYYEKAKQGETDDVLNVLVDYIACVLKEKSPDASKVGRMSRKIEFLTKQDLCIMSMIYTYSRIETGMAKNEREALGLFVSTSRLYPIAGSRIDHPIIQQSLSELANRNLLREDSVARYDKNEPWYTPTADFDEILRASKEIRDLRP